MSRRPLLHASAAALALSCFACAKQVAVEQASTESSLTTTTEPPTTTSTVPSAPPGPTAEQITAYVDALKASEWQAAFSYAIAISPKPAPRPAYVAPKPAPAPRASTGGGAPANSFLACVRNRESRGNYSAVNPSSGAGGAYQFMPGTWAGAGFAARYGVPRAELATPAQQDAAAAELYARSGRAPWAGPGC